MRRNEETGPPVTVPQERLTTFQLSTTTNSEQMLLHSMNIATSSEDVMDHGVGTTETSQLVIVLDGARRRGRPRGSGRAFSRRERELQNVLPQGQQLTVFQVNAAVNVGRQSPSPAVNAGTLEK